MSLVYVIGLVAVVLLLVIWYIKSLQKGYDQGEDDFPNMSPLDTSTVQDYSEFSKFDDLEKHDTRPIPLQDLGTTTTPPGR